MRPLAVCTARIPLSSAGAYLHSMHSGVLHINADLERTSHHEQPLPNTHPALRALTKNPGPVLKTH